jgi:hypothetical protein
VWASVCVWATLWAPPFFPSVPVGWGFDRPSSLDWIFFYQFYRFLVVFFHGWRRFCSLFLLLLSLHRWIFPVVVLRFFLLCILHLYPLGLGDATGRRWRLTRAPPTRGGGCARVRHERSFAMCGPVQARGARPGVLMAGSRRSTGWSRGAS